MDSRYIIITPAYNESRNVEKTIQGVLSQTILPKAWIIVDDDSTDNTGEIVKAYAEKHTFIRYLHRNKDGEEAYYSSNVFAIDYGYNSVLGEKFDFLAILDADIVLPPDYYQFILNEFDKDQTLGTASGIYQNLVDGELHTVLNDRRSTPKAIQVFRKEVYEEIGGYRPLPFGGEDTISCVMTRMMGKKAWSFPEAIAVHLRPTGMGVKDGIVGVRYRQGFAEQQMGTHPLFFLLKAVRRMFLEKPFVLGGFARMTGYLISACGKRKLDLPEAVVKKLREEQVERILGRNRIGNRRAGCSELSL